MKKILLIIALLISGLGLNAQSVIIDDLEFTVTSETPAECAVSGYSGEPVNVTIPSTVTISGKEYTVTSIREWAFAECSSLTSIEIPSGVTYIGNSAFQGCTSLTSIYCYAENIPGVMPYMFSGCPSDMVIYVPAISVNAYKTTLPWGYYTIIPWTCVVTASSNQEEAGIISGVGEYTFNDTVTETKNLTDRTDFNSTNTQTHNTTDTETFNTTDTDTLNLQDEVTYGSSNTETRNTLDTTSKTDNTETTGSDSKTGTVTVAGTVTDTQTRNTTDTDTGTHSEDLDETDYTLNWEMLYRSMPLLNKVWEIFDDLFMLIF